VGVEKGWYTEVGIYRCRCVVQGQWWRTGECMRSGVGVGVKGIRAKSRVRQNPVVIHP
jgi:hypothetical protein